MARPVVVRALAVVLCLVALSGCASSSSPTRALPKYSRALEENPLIDRHDMLSRIMLQMGAPYALSGTDSSGFDCSGFIATIYRDALQRTLPHSCVEQFQAGIPVDQRALKFGDLVFFTFGPAEEPSHVGIYVGDGLFAHAGTSSGVTVTPLTNPYFKKKFAGARRVVY
jgi:cell wall-associated NlpC family hydrolase